MIEIQGGPVTAIAATGVLGEFSYDVEYAGSSDEERMRLVYAPNGRGKTNFLRAINFLSNPSPESLQALIEIPLESLDVRYANGGMLSLRRPKGVPLGTFEAAVKKTSEDKIVSVSVDPADFAGRLYRRVWDQRNDYSEFARAASAVSSGSVFIGDDRLAPPLEDPREAARPEHARRRNAGSVSRLLDSVERMLTQAAIAGLARESNQNDVYRQLTRATLAGSSPLSATQARAALEEQIQSLLASGTVLEKYGLLSMRQVRDIADELAVARANNRKLPSVHTVLKPYFDSLAEQIITLAPTQELIDTFVTAVNHFLDRKNLRFSASAGIHLVGRDGARLDVENLSSGERHLLLLLSHAILATVDSPLVIIDEPELSLGLEWQRDLLPELLKCSRSSQVQFLVASHSVQIMSAVEPESIVEPTEDD